MYRLQWSCALKMHVHVPIRGVSSFQRVVCIQASMELGAEDVSLCVLISEGGTCILRPYPYSIPVFLSLSLSLQIITLIIRKHLSWLIVWGNLSGAIIGLLSEVASLLAAD